MIFSKSLIGIVAIISGAFCMNENFIQPDNSKIQYFGRFDFSNPKGVAFDWPGVYIKGEFIGTECKVVLGGHSRYDVTIDEKSTVTVTVDSLKDTITSAEKLERRNHSIVIVKRTESNSAPSFFYGFILDNKAKMLNPSDLPKRKIEFIGDSYTAGFGNESTSRECSPDKCNELIFLSTNTSKAFGPLIASRLEEARPLDEVGRVDEQQQEDDRVPDVGADIGPARDLLAARGAREALPLAAPDA
jgi:hypothetical protein